MFMSSLPFLVFLWWKQPYTSQNYHVLYNMLLLCPHYTEISHHASVWCNFRFDSFSASRKRNEERWQCSWSETIDEPHHMLIRFACKCIFFNIPRDGLVSMLFMSSLSLVSTLNNHSSSFSLENLQPQRKKKSIENAVVSHNLFICS